MEFDLLSRTFTKGYYFKDSLYKKYLRRFHIVLDPELCVYDPNSEFLLPNGSLHINNVFFEDDKIFFSGAKIKKLYYISNDKLSTYAKIPLGTHNSRPYKDGVLINDTAHDAIQYLNKKSKRKYLYKVKSYLKKELKYTNLSEDYARQSFARGLCVRGDLIIGGSSPATITVYRYGESQPIKYINLTKDIRNAIHGLEIWPY